MGAPGVHFGSILGSILEAFWGHFWEVKSVKFLGCFCVGFGVDLGAVWDPKMAHFGSLGGHRERKGEISKTSVLHQENYGF